MIGLEAYWEPFFCHAATELRRPDAPLRHIGVSHHSGTLRKVARLLGL